MSLTNQVPGKAYANILSTPTTNLINKLFTFVLFYFFRWIFSFLSCLLFPSNHNFSVFSALFFLPSQTSFLENLSLGNKKRNQLCNFTITILNKRNDVLKASKTSCSIIYFCNIIVCILFLTKSH